MMDLNFLPDDYAERRERKRRPAAQLIMCGAILIALSAASTYQSLLQARLDSQLQTVETAHTVASRQLDDLGRVQQQLKRRSRDAMLGVYLKQPWPSSRVLTEIVSRLGPETRLESIDIRYAQAHGGVGETGMHDLDRLKREAPADDATMELRGVTAEISAAQRFSSRLRQCPLFEAVVLDQVEARHAPDGSRSSSFRIQARLRRVTQASPAQEKSA